jgi:FHA domain-containing protein
MPTPITLKVFRGAELLRTEQFTREIIKIGRLATAHLSLEDDRISRIHAVVEVSPEGVVSIIDMGSAEGTFVNGKKVSRAPVRPGDAIGLGGLRIVLEAPGAAEAPGQPPAPVQRPVAVTAPVAAAPVAAGPAPAAPAPAPAAVAAPVVAPARAPAVAAPAPARAPVAAPAAAPAAVAVPVVAPAPAPAPAAPVARAPRAAPSGRHAKRRWALPASSAPAEDLSHGDVGVELRLLWRDTLIDAGAFVAPKSPVLVGEGDGCALAVPASLLPEPRFPVLRHQGGQYAFAFARGMTGAVEDRGTRTTLAELVKEKKAEPDDKVQGAYWITVPRAGAVRAELGGGLALEARARRPEHIDVPPWWERINYQFLNLFLILFFVQAGFVVAANNFPYETDVLADDLFKNPSRMAKFIIKPPEAPKPAEKLPGEKKEKSEQSGEMAEKHKGEEGQMGKKDAPKTSGKSAPKAIDPNAKEVVKRMGVLGALGRGGGGGLATVFGSGGLGGDIRGATGNMFGTAAGDSFGFGGLGVRGTGTGGGGAGETVGIGGIGTKGRGGGLGGYGQGVGGLGRKTDRDVAITAGNATVIGSIDKELIRAVIKEHAQQIRFCYEEQLAVNPKLAGKVVIRWTIDADGNASNASVDGSGTSLSDDKVHQCMMARIVSWQFPKPKGGGIAVITYPWILRAAGAE